MTDTSLRFPPESTNVNGKKVAFQQLLSFGAGDVHVPYQFSGDSATYIAAVTGSAVSANKNHIGMWKTDSTRKVRIRQIYATTLDADGIELRIEGINSALTNGTAITPRKYSTSFENLPTGITIESDPDNTPLANWILGSCSIRSDIDRNYVFRKEGDASTIQVNTNEGFVVRQTDTAGTGTVSVFIVFSTD